MSYIVFYILVSFIVAALGVNRKFGFWGYFFYSLLFTPFLGFILLMASSRKIPGKSESN